MCLPMDDLMVTPHPHFAQGPYSVRRDTHVTAGNLTRKTCWMTAACTTLIVSYHQCSVAVGCNSATEHSLCKPTTPRVNISPHEIVPVAWSPPLQLIGVTDEGAHRRSPVPRGLWQIHGARVSPLLPSLEELYGLLLNTHDEHLQPVISVIFNSHTTSILTGCGQLIKDFSYWMSIASHRPRMTQLQKLIFSPQLTVFQHRQWTLSGSLQIIFCLMTIFGRRGTATQELG